MTAARLASSGATARLALVTTTAPPKQATANSGMSFFMMSPPTQTLPRKGGGLQGGSLGLVDEIVHRDFFEVLHVLLHELRVQRMIEVDLQAIEVVEQDE